MRFIKNTNAAFFVNSCGFKVVPHTKVLAFSQGCGGACCGGMYTKTQKGFIVYATAKQLAAIGIKSSAAANVTKYYATGF